VRQVALLGVMGTMDDPERLRNLRQGLLRADAEVSAFFASERELVCELDANGVFMRLNPRWQDQLGYALEEMQPRPWTEFVHPDDLVAARDALDKLKGKIRSSSRTGSGTATAATGTSPGRPPAGRLQA